MTWVNWLFNLFYFTNYSFGCSWIWFTNLASPGFRKCESGTAIVYTLYTVFGNECILVHILFITSPVLGTTTANYIRDWHVMLVQYTPMFFFYLKWSSSAVNNINWGIGLQLLLSSLWLQLIHLLNGKCNLSVNSSIHLFQVFLHIKKNFSYCQQWSSCQLFTSWSTFTKVHTQHTPVNQIQTQCLLLHAGSELRSQE